MSRYTAFRAVKCQVGDCSPFTQHAWIMAHSMPELCECLCDLDLWPPDLRMYQFTPHNFYYQSINQSINQIKSNLYIAPYVASESEANSITASYASAGTGTAVVEMSLCPSITLWYCIKTNKTILHWGKAWRLGLMSFPIIEPLTVLMVAQSFIFLHSSACSIWQYEILKKN